MGSFRKAAEVALDDANRAHEARYLRYFFSDDAFVLSGRLAPDAGAVVAAALDRARAESFNAPQDGEASPPDSDDRFEGFERTAADALVAVAEAALAAPDGARPPVPEVVVHVDADVLAQDAPDGRCELEGGPQVAPETARRMSCDAVILALVEKDGEAIRAGRQTRRISHALRRALEARDRTCRFPGCHRVARTQAHHVEHWTKDGPTQPDNLMLLCCLHHRLVHEGGYRIEGSPSAEVTFVRPDGSVVELPRRRRAAGRIEDFPRSTGTAVDTALELPEGAGTSIDIAYVTDALFFQPAVWPEVEKELRAERDPPERDPRL